MEQGPIAPSPCPLPIRRGRGVSSPSPLWGEGRVRGDCYPPYTGVSATDCILHLLMLCGGAATSGGISESISIISNFSFISLSFLVRAREHLPDQMIPGPDRRGI